MKRHFKAITALVLTVAMVLSMVVITKTDANAVAYSGSSYYMSGPYYQKLLAVTLTGNPRVDIVNIAKSQIGYQEGNNSTQLAGTVIGANNYTEYGRWYSPYVGDSYNHIASQWCGMFVSWCAALAGISSSVILPAQYTENSFAQFRNQGVAYSWATVQAGGYVPEAGDIVYFLSSSGAASGRNVNHVGIVTGFSNYTLYTIEGNTGGGAFTTDGGACADRSYGIADTYVAYICRPNYPQTYSTGVHQVTADSLNVRTAPETGTVIGALTAGERFNCLEVVNNTWGRINYYGQTAYISLNPSYVSRVSYSTAATVITDPTDLVFDNAAMVEWSARGCGDAGALLCQDNIGIFNIEFFATTNTSDPMAYLLFTDTASFYVNDYKYVSIVAKTTSSVTDAAMFFCAGSVQNPSTSNMKTWNWINDGEWHEYIIDISTLNLSGYLNCLRFDFFNNYVTTGTLVYMRSLRFMKEVSTPTVSVSSPSIVEGGSMTFTFSGLDTYFNGADCLHPYMAICAEGTKLSDHNPVLWNYVAAEGTKDLKTGFQGTYAGQDLPVGNYKVYLTYNTTGRDTFLPSVYLNSASSVASFSIIESTGCVGTDTGAASVSTVATADVGTTVNTAIAEYAALFSLPTVTITAKDGNAVSGTATLATGMLLNAGGNVYKIVIAGDTNGNGNVEVGDVQNVINHIRTGDVMGAAELDALAAAVGDTNCNILSVTKLLNEILGIS